MIGDSLFFYCPFPLPFPRPFFALLRPQLFQSCFSHIICPYQLCEGNLHSVIHITMLLIARAKVVDDQREGEVANLIEIADGAYSRIDSLGSATGSWYFDTKNQDYTVPRRWFSFVQIAGMNSAQ